MKIQKQLSALPLCLALAFSSDLHGQPVTNRVTPIADAYVRSDIPGNNYGTFTNVWVRTNAAAGTATCYGYLKFSLTTLANVNTAALRLNASMQYTGSVSLLAYSVADTNWGETAITWNNRPPANNFLTTITVNVTNVNSRWYEFDVSNFIKGELAAGRSFATLLLVEPTILAGNTANYAKINSREFAVNQPELAWVPLPTVRIYSSATTVSEGGADITITVERRNSPINQPLTVRFSILEAGQIAGLVDALSLAPRFLTIPANTTSASATVHAVDDQYKTGDANGNKAMTVILKQVPGSYIVDAAQPSVQITITEATVSPDTNTAEGWPEVFNPWKVRKLYLTMSPDDWQTLVNLTQGTPPEFPATFSDGSTALAAQVSAKDAHPPGRFTIRIDFGAGRWNGLKKLNLHAGEADRFLSEGLASYLHSLASGTHGYNPFLSSFVEVWVNGTQPQNYAGVFLSVEMFDREFIDNRQLRRKNSTWGYKSNPPTREYPDDPPDSPTFANIGVQALPSDANLERYFDADAVMTQMAIDKLIANPDGIAANNNVNRVDFYYPPALWPNGPGLSFRKSFCSPRDFDLDQHVFQPDCLQDGNNPALPMSQLETTRYGQRRFEILQELVQGKYSQAGLTEIVNRLQFMLQESLDADPYLQFSVPFSCGHEAVNAAQRFDEIRAWIGPRLNLLNAAFQGLTGLPGKPVFSRSNNDVTISNPNATSNPNMPGEIWYTTDGTDPWTVNNTAQGTHTPDASAMISLNDTRHIIARIKNGNSWSPATRQTFTVAGSGASIQISELMYRPNLPNAAEIAEGFDNLDGDGDDEFEFIELSNTGTVDVDLSDYYFEGSFTYGFPPGTKITSGCYFVLASNPKAFETRYQGKPYNGAYWHGHIGFNETVTLRKPDGTIIDSVIANKTSSLGGGNVTRGYPIVRSLGGVWSQGTTINGLPGADVAPAPPTVGIATSGAIADEASVGVPAVLGTFVVSRSGCATAPLTVEFDISGTATLNSDYSAPVSVTIPTGESSATITVNPISDANYEPNETVIFAIRPNSNYTIDSQAANSTITIQSISEVDPAEALIGTGINSYGTGVGVSYGTQTRGIRFNRLGQATLTLPPFSVANHTVPFSINNAGNIVGGAWDASGHTKAFLYRADGTMIDLNTLGGNGAGAVRITDNGIIVGSSYTAAGSLLACYWVAQSSSVNGPYSLGALPNKSSSTAMDVNGAGVIVGDSQGLPFAYRDNQILQLITPYGYPGAGDDIVSINSAGTIVGSSYNPNDGIDHPIRWQWNGTTYVATDLGVNLTGCPGACGGIYPMRINSSGNIVAYAWILGINSYRVLLWRGNGWECLDSVVGATDWSFQIVQDINIVGDILGGGMHSGQWRYFLVKP